MNKPEKETKVVHPFISLHLFAEQTFTSTFRESEILLCFCRSGIRSVWKGINDSKISSNNENKKRFLSLRSSGSIAGEECKQIITYSNKVMPLWCQLGKEGPHSHFSLKRQKCDFCQTQCHLIESIVILHLLSINTMQLLPGLPGNNRMRQALKCHFTDKETEAYRKLESKL